MRLVRPVFQRSKNRVHIMWRACGSFDFLAGLVYSTGKSRTFELFQQREKVDHAANRNHSYHAQERTIYPQANVARLLLGGVVVLV